MPIKPMWDNEEKTIMRIDFIGEFTVDEYVAGVREQTAMLDSVDHKVDFISYVADISLPKDTLANLAKLTDTPALTHPNAGIVVTVGDSRFVEIMGNIFGKVGGQQAGKLVFASTLEEAYEIIKEQQMLRVG